MYTKALTRAGMIISLPSFTLLGFLTGCVGYAEQPRAGIVYQEPAPRLAPGFVEQEEYVYYPGYETYYGSRSHQYYYRQGNAWVTRPAPAGISVNLLLASPSVKMDFHDGPAAHHTQMMQKYPKTWKKSPGNQGLQDKNSGKDKRDDNRK